MSFCAAKFVELREHGRRALVSPFRFVLPLLVALLFAGSFGAPAHAAEPDTDEPGPIVLAHVDQILGHWQRGEGEAIIEISERNGVHRGIIVWSQKRPETVGIEVFRELRYDPEAREWHGRAYSIKRKREVRIDIAVPSRNALELTAHILIFTKDVDFNRVPSARLAALRDKTGL